MNNLGFENIFSVFTVFPDDNGQPIKRLAGRFLLHDSKVQVLQDYFGLLDGLDGPTDDYRQRRIHALAHSMHTSILSDREWQQGKDKNLIPYGDLQDQASMEEVDDDPESKPTSKFKITSPESGPMVVHVRNNTLLIDGKPLEESQVQYIMGGLDSGSHSCEYLGKAEEVSVMFKMEPALEEALKAMQEAVKGGHLPRHHMRAISNALFKDSMVPSLGNKAAYADFLAKKKPGVHIMIDANGFKHINDQFGHEAGDMAIESMGSAIRSALDETVKNKRDGHAARFGGDEFAVHVPTAEHAAQFARTLRAKLDEVPPIGGTHRLSASIGMGETPEQADLSQYKAKAHGKSKGYAPGQAQTHIHSSLPGQEGPIAEPGFTKPPESVKPAKPLENATQAIAAPKPVQTVA